MDRQEIESRAIRADQILNDELFVSAWEKVEREAVEAMLALPPEDVAALSEKAAQIRALRNVRAEIRSAMLNWQDAEQRRARMAKIA